MKDGAAATETCVLPEAGAHGKNAAGTFRREHS
jgi:hypothetical protein